MKFRLIALFAVAALVTVACTKSQSMDQRAGQNGTQPTATAAANTTGDLKEEANRLLSRGEPVQAIIVWKAIVAKEPTADNYNELSYAYLSAKQWQEALTAGDLALKLQADHNYATYNTGMAALKLGDLCIARQRLEVSIEQQPDRYEPRIGLARVYQGLRDYPAALREAQKAVQLSDNAREAEAALAQVESMRANASPADLSTSGTIVYEDGSVTVYLYPEKPFRGCDGLWVPQTLFSVHKQGKTLSLPGVSKPSRVALPGGANGFFFRGKGIGAGVSGSYEYSLWVDDGHNLFPVEFKNKPNGGGERWLELTGPVMRSRGVPVVEGHLITGQYKDDAIGYYNEFSTWRLSSDLTTATLESTRTADPLEPFQAQKGTVVSISQDKLVMAVDGKNVEFPTAGFEVRARGGYGSLSDLKPGTPVRLALRDGKLLRIELDR